MSILYFDGTSEQKERAKQYRDKLLGQNALEYAPHEYWATKMLTELPNVSLPDWESYDLHHKAQLIATYYLSNMLEVINAHYREQDEAKRRLSQK